ncbi:MAG: PLP-dependent aminotransferase family protein [Bauldia sp.]|nr:PLP-dependent aminotransferase family protein [Bauldia sp.]
MTNRVALLFDAVQFDRNLEMPIHRQLYELLRSYIIDGRLSAGSRLPATRALAEALKVGRNTVIAAYEQLLTEGYLEARSGSGTWVAEVMRHSPRPSRPSAGAVSLRFSRRGDAITSQPQFGRRPHKINFHPGFPEIGTFPFSTWARLLARNARSRAEDLLGYYHSASHPALQESIAEYVRVARGVDCSAEQVIVVTGAQAALDLLARILLDDGDVAWMEEPGYLGARTALLAGGACLAPLRVSENGWVLNDPTLPPPRLIYVTPSCQWPFGTIMPLEDRLHLLTIADRHGAWIVEDDYDGEYRFRGRAVSAMQGLDPTRVVYVGTFGKTLFSSLRLGFMIVPLELAEAFDRTVTVTGHVAPLLLQATLADFIRQGYFATHLRQMRALYARRQERFVDLCREHLAEWMTVSENDSGMQLLGRFIRPFDDRRVAEMALSYGVDAQPVSANYVCDDPQHGLLLGYARLNDRESRAAIMALRKAFQTLEPAPSAAGRRVRADGVAPS